MNWANIVTELKTISIGEVKFVLRKWPNHVKRYLELKIAEGREINAESGIVKMTGKIREEDFEEQDFVRLKYGIQRWHIQDDNGNPVEFDDENLKVLMGEYPDVANKILEELVTFNFGILADPEKKKL